MVATAQQTAPSKSATSSVPEPKLPVIDYKACPGEGRTVPNWKIKREDKIYSSWQGKRVLVGTLKAGEEVTVLAGVNVIRKPDRALVTQADGNLRLKPGDVVLLYGLHSDGYYDFWAKGIWFTYYYEAVAGKGNNCGFADKSQCTVTIINNGVKEWWVQVRVDSDPTGWVLARKSTGDRYWNSGNFDELCQD